VAAERFETILSRYNFNPGDTAELVRPTESDKFFLRFDFNIGDDHQLTLRHNYVDASNLINRPSSTTYEWDSEGYDFNSETNSSVAQINSVFGTSKFNEGRVTLQSVKDRRPGVSFFPWVEVEEIEVSGSADEYEAGTEPFSTRNSLDQDVIEIHDDFTWLLGDHTLTLGTHNEFFTFDNLFVQNAFGSYEFTDMTYFEQGLAREWEWTTIREGFSPSQEFDVNQFGIYGGDQWAVKPNLTLTYGLRLDVPFFPDDPSRNPLTEELYGLRTDQMPDGEELWQPRVGFNWDIRSDGQQQLRGGLGLFAGRTPYVWISNAYARTGVEQIFWSFDCDQFFERGDPLRDGCLEFNPDP
jgi:outer membrane receptor protein involved in Fe transport